MQGLESKKKDLEIPLTGMAEKKETRELCPFVENPHDDCYIVTLESLKVEAAIYYCGGNYKKCDLYQRLVKDRQ